MPASTHRRKTSTRTRPAVPGSSAPYRGPILDVHAHPWLEGFPTIRSGAHGPSEYLADTAGLDLRGAAALAMAPRGDLGRTKAFNDAVLALAKAPGSRFYAVCSVHPEDAEGALAEVSRVRLAGARGLKLHPNTQQFDVADPRVTEVVRRAAEEKLPVLFDAYSPFDADQPGKFVRLAMAVPDAKLVLAHAHGPRFADLLVYEILARYDWWRRNVYVDLSATTTLLAGGPFAPSYLWVLRKVGVDRLLFGSDYPLDAPKEAVAAVAGLGFTEEELDRIFFRNASELYGFPTEAPHPP